MISEKSEITGSRQPREIVYYDGECELCSDLTRRAGPWLSREGFGIDTLQSEGAEALGVPRDRLLEEMRIRTRDGRVLGGADALLFLARRTWWARPVLALGSFALGRSLLRWAYRRVAANRRLLGRLLGIGRRIDAGAASTGGPR